jgi:hypothetical protein
MTRLCPRKDRPGLSSERAPYRDRTRNSRPKLLKRKQYVVKRPQSGLDTKTHWLTVSLKVTLTLQASVLHCYIWQHCMFMYPWFLPAHYLFPSHNTHDWCTPEPSVLVKNTVVTFTSSTADTPMNNFPCKCSALDIQWSASHTWHYQSQTHAEALISLKSCGCRPQICSQVHI